MGGGASNFSHHYNSTAKRSLGWLPSSYVHFPKANGVYRLYAFDQPQLEEGKRYTLNVTKSGSINCWSRPENADSFSLGFDDLLVRPSRFEFDG